MVVGTVSLDEAVAITNPHKRRAADQKEGREMKKLGRVDVKMPAGSPAAAKLGPQLKPL